MKTAGFTLAISTLMLLAGSAAHAASRVGEVPTKAVSFRDLDLSTAQGARTLYDRIEDAAREVCRGTEIVEIHSCRTRAIEDAIKDVGSPLLSAVNRSSADRVDELALR